MSLIKKISTSGLVWLWVSLLIIALDRNTKLWAMHALTFHEPVQVFSFFNLTLAYNTGAAFSFLHNASGWQNWTLGSLAVLVSGYILYTLSKLPMRSCWMSIALCLIMGGAIGNAWDRLTFGFVIDFLSFHWEDWYFAIFNIADAAISVGAAMLFLCWVGIKKA